MTHLFTSQSLMFLLSPSQHELYSACCMLHAAQYTRNATRYILQCYPLRARCSSTSSLHATGNKPQLLHRYMLRATSSNCSIATCYVGAHLVRIPQPSSLFCLYLSAFSPLRSLFQFPVISLGQSLISFCFYSFSFLVACTRLYSSLCPSVCLSVCRSVCLSVCNHCVFYRFFCTF